MLNFFMGGKLVFDRDVEKRRLARNRWCLYDVEAVIVKRLGGVVQARNPRDLEVGGVMFRDTGPRVTNAFIICFDGYIRAPCWCIAGLLIISKSYR